MYQLCAVRTRRSLGTKLAESHANTTAGITSYVAEMCCSGSAEVWGFSKYTWYFKTSLEKNYKESNAANAKSSSCRFPNALNNTRQKHDHRNVRRGN